MQLIVNNITTQAVASTTEILKFNLEQELREYLRVKLDNIYHIRKAIESKGQKYFGDDYHYLITKSGIFATGFLPMVLSFLEEFDTQIKLIDQRKNLPKFLSEISYGNIGNYEPFPHQFKLIESVNRHINGDFYFPRGIWKAATNSGKTLSLAGLINSVVDPKPLLLVDTIDLLTQHTEYYEDIYGKGSVGIIHGKKFEVDKFITIAMNRTLYNRLAKSRVVFNQLQTLFNILAVDEFHGFAGQHDTVLLSKINAGLRLGMSGTPLDSSSQMAKFKLIGHTGDVLASITKKYLMDNGFSMAPIINIYKNPEKVLAFSYDEDYSANVLNSIKRAELIAKLINQRRGKKILITFFEKNHGYLMYETFLRMFPEYMEITTVVEGTDNLRQDKVAAFKSGRIRILFASTILQQGINIKDIEVGIYGQAGKEAIALSQFLGRCERLDGINHTFEWIDFYDNGNYTSKHSVERFKFYKREALEINYQYAASNKGIPKD
jgi:superfamily II DNA or RNA helicase